MTEKQPVIPLKKALLPKEMRDALEHMDDLNKYAFIFGTMAEMQTRLEEAHKRLDKHEEKINWLEVTCDE